MVEELYTPEQLAQMHDSLWKCVLQFANFSATQERHRIARDLHDSLGHALTALNFQLQTAMQLCEPDPNQAQEFLNEAHNLVKIATKEVRQSVKALRDDGSETQSLPELVEFLVNDFHHTTGILPTVEINLLVAIPSEFVTPIYRIIQEALNNIRKYANATAVQVEICTTPTQVYVIIQDNGQGFDPQEVCGGYGLRGMQERILFLQGNFQLESQPGDGCCITVEIPIGRYNQAAITPLLQDSEDISTSSLSNISSIPSIRKEENHPVDKHRADGQIVSEITVYQEDCSVTEPDIPLISESTTVLDNNSKESDCNSEIFAKPIVYIGEWQSFNLDL